MEELEVRTDLEVRIRSELEPVVERMQERHERQAAMNDEEWRAHVTQALVRINPDFTTWPEEKRELFLQHRRQSSEGPGGST